MEYQRKIVIHKPLKKLVKWMPKKKEEKTTYLTANFVFSERIHFSEKARVQDEIKTYLLDFLVDIPRLQKLEMDITYFDNREIWDIDNRDYFWRKLILDMFKIPTPKQIEKARKYRREIITLNVLEDDNVKFYRGGKHYYGGKGDMMVIELRGELYNKQNKLFN